MWPTGSAPSVQAQLQSRDLSIIFGQTTATADHTTGIAQYQDLYMHAPNGSYSVCFAATSDLINVSTTTTDQYDGTYVACVAVHCLLPKVDVLCTLSCSAASCCVDPCHDNLRSDLACEPSLVTFSIVLTLPVVLLLPIC